jgi:hypothetical protein
MSERDSRLRIIVLGYLVRGPVGGLAWHHLQYVMAAAGLGHDVYFIEDSDDYPSCYVPTTDTTGIDPGYGLAFATAVFDRVGFGDRWAYYDAHRGFWCGPAAGRAPALCRSADLLINVSGMNPIRPWLAEVPARALIDTDPAFTQIRHLVDAAARARTEAHNVFFTFGENLAAGRADLPDDGFAWQPTRQPLALEAWPLMPPPRTGLLTTVMQWQSYPAQTHQGRRYGMKAEAFDPFIDLPHRAGRRFALAVGGAPEAQLRSFGWRLFDPIAVTRDPWTYQRFIQRSMGEFAVAKHGYVVSHSGWFSERSACYLASGRPVVVEDTGFSDWLPVGEGVIGFTTADEALAGIALIDAHYTAHCRAAREIAETFFDGRQVMAALIEAARNAASNARAPSHSACLATDPGPDGAGRTPC